MVSIHNFIMMMMMIKKKCGTTETRAQKVPSPSSQFQILIHIVHFCLELLCDIPQKGACKLLLQGRVAHHEGNQLSHFCPLDVSHDDHEIAIKLLLLLRSELHDDLRQRLECSTGKPAAQKASDGSTCKNKAQHCQLYWPWKIFCSDHWIMWVNMLRPYLSTDQLQFREDPRPALQRRPAHPPWLLPWMIVSLWSALVDWQTAHNRASWRHQPVDTYWRVGLGGKK